MIVPASRCPLKCRVGTLVNSAGIPSSLSHCGAAIETKIKKYRTFHLSGGIIISTAVTTDKDLNKAFASEESPVIIWTFAGDKINRTISPLLSALIKENIDCDYMNVMIDRNKKNDFSIRDIKRFGISYRREIDVKWFSKFSDWCIAICCQRPVPKFSFTFRS